MITCKSEAKRWVHRYAAAGAAFSAIPLPITSAGLATIETHMFAFIGEIYGDAPGAVVTAAAGGSFAIVGHGLKWLALRGSQLLPVVGPAIKMGIAAVVIESIGHGMVQHYERKYPGKMFTRRT